MSIAIEHLSHTYGENRVLRDISLHIPSGESVGIIGISGGGKSTLLKIISGLYEAQSGEVVILGESTCEKRREKVAMVMQNPCLFPSSIRDNITCGHPIEAQFLRDICDAAQLSPWLASLEKGIDTHVGERGSSISGGQAQRISIARAMAKNAPVILLDEPTSALDNGMSTSILESLQALTMGKTLVHVSHRPETLIGCDRVYKLEGGRLHEA